MRVSGNIQKFVESLMMAIGLATTAQGQDFSLVLGGKMVSVPRSAS
jgi:hypothetical protein